MSVSNIHKAYKIKGRNLITEPLPRNTCRAVKQMNFQSESNLVKRRSPLGSTRQTESDDCPHLTIGDFFGSEITLVKLF